MGRRRPTGPTSARPAASVPVRLWWQDGAERIARGYLATLLAAVMVGFALVLASAITPALCAGREDAGECGLGVTLAVSLFGFALAIVPASLIVRLGWGHAAAVVAGYSLLVVNPAIDQAWWWVAWALLPMPAALASGEVAPRFVTAQRVLLGVLALAGVGAMVWWLVAGR